MEQPPNTAVNLAGTITARFMEVTPDLAAMWLENNNQMNRRKRRGQADALASDMREGYWEDNGESIIFDSDSQLVNGQHRLTAVVESGQTKEFLVVFGVNPFSRTTIDANARRTFADDLTMTGVTQGAIREALIRLMLRWDKFGGLADVSWRPSRRLMASRYGLYEKGLDETISETQRWRPKWPGNKVAMQFTWWLLATRLNYDREKITRFFSILTIGSQDPEDEMLVRMRAKIGTPVAVSSHGEIIHMNAGVETYWLIQAWNRWITGSRKHYLTPHAGISDPFTMPESTE